MMVTLRFQAKGRKVAKLQFREEKGEGFTSLLSVVCVCFEEEVLLFFFYLIQYPQSDPTTLS